MLAFAMLALVSCKEEVTSRVGQHRIEGIDISRYQNEIDWQAVAADGIAFAYMKATEGVEHIDPSFCDNWASAKTANVISGAYHFYRPELDPRTQAENFFAQVALSPGDLPPVLDVETLDDASRTQLITGMRTWLYLTEIKTGARPIIYTNLGFYYRHLAGHFDDYAFWIARYSDREPAIAAGAQLAFWQYGDRGRVKGIDGDVDLNVYLGSREAFEALRIPEPEVLTFRASSRLPGSL